MIFKSNFLNLLDFNNKDLFIKYKNNLLIYKLIKKSNFLDYDLFTIILNENKLFLYSSNDNYIEFINKEDFLLLNKKIIDNINF